MGSEAPSHPHHSRILCCFRTPDLESSWSLTLLWLHRAMGTEAATALLPLPRSYVL